MKVGDVHKVGSFSAEDINNAKEGFTAEAVSAVASFALVASWHAAVSANSAKFVFATGGLAITSVFFLQ